MAFEETRFPLTISYGSAGGPGFKTGIVTVDSGYEERTARWSESRRSYNVAWGMKEQSDLETLINWFEAMRGAHIGFRYRDPLDWKSCATEETPAQDDHVLLAAAIGGETTTQIIKSYDIGGQARARDIQKPVNGTILIDVNDVLQIEGTDYAIDYTTGIITWDTSPYPTGLTVGDTVKAGYEFDVPVRFANDSIMVSIEEYRAGAAEIPIVEIRV